MHSQLEKIWIVLGLISLAQVFCVSVNGNDNGKLLCFICENCAEISSSPNTQLMECNGDYFNKYENPNNAVNTDDDDDDDDDEIMATVITISSSNATVVNADDDYSTESTTTTSMTTTTTEATTATTTTKTIPQEATTLRATPNIDQTFNSTNQTVTSIYHNRSGPIGDDTVDGLITTTTPTTPTTTITLTDITSSSAAAETTTPTIVTVTKENEQSTKRMNQSASTVNLAGNVSIATEETTTTIPTITTKLKPISPINPELVIHPSTGDPESQYIKNYENASIVTTTSSTTTTPSTLTQETAAAAAAVSASALTTNNKNYKPSNDFRIRTARHTLPNISYHCIKLETMINGSTIIKRGCAKAINHNKEQSVCEQWQQMHPHLEINDCETCTQSECNGTTTFHLSFSVPFFILIAALLQANYSKQM